MTNQSAPVENMQVLMHEDLADIEPGAGRPDSDFSLHSELEAAAYFCERYGRLLRFCDSAGGWFVYDGRRWQRDVDGAIERYAQQCVTEIADGAATIDDLELRKKRLSFAINLQKRRGIENVIEIAKSREPIAARFEAFDRDPFQLNVRNGTVDLRTGELEPHASEAMHTLLGGCAFEADAACPRWEQFLAEIFGGDEYLINFVRRAAGYSLTGDTREQVLFILHGTGANGKTTFLRVLANALGDYARAAAAETFTERREGASNDLARLSNARFVPAVETNEGRTLAEGFVKAVTGGDKLTARFLYREYFEFVPAFKIWLATNHRPIVRGVDEGIWRRIRLVPFEQRFDADQRDPHLRQKLEAEFPGILAWAVRGALEWQRHGLGDAGAVRCATDAYRDEMDTFADFIDQWCEVDERASAGSTELYRTYREWAEKSGERPVTQTRFGLRLAERGFRSARTTRQRLWTGIGIRRNDDAYDGFAVDFPNSPHTRAREKVTENGGKRVIASLNVSSVGQLCSICKRIDGHCRLDDAGNAVCRDCAA